MSDLVCFLTSRKGGKCNATPTFIEWLKLFTFRIQAATILDSFYVRGVPVFGSCVPSSLQVFMVCDILGYPCHPTPSRSRCLPNGGPTLLCLSVKTPSFGFGLFQFILSILSTVPVGGSLRMHEATSTLNEKGYPWPTLSTVPTLHSIFPTPSCRYLVIYPPLRFLGSISMSSQRIFPAYMIIKS